jgi:hypothetical protein
MGSSQAHGNYLCPSPPLKVWAPREKEQNISKTLGIIWSRTWSLLMTAGNGGGKWRVSMIKSFLGKVNSYWLRRENIKDASGFLSPLIGLWPCFLICHLSLCFLGIFSTTMSNIHPDFMVWTVWIVWLLCSQWFWALLPSALLWND